MDHGISTVKFTQNKKKNIKIKEEKKVKPYR